MYSVLINYIKKGGLLVYRHDNDYHLFKDDTRNFVVMMVSTRRFEIVGWGHIILCV